MRDGAHSYLLGRVVGAEDFVDVVTVELGEGYDWDTLAAFYSPSRRRYFWASGRGCSCDSLSSQIGGLGDFGDGGRLALAEAVREKWGNGYRLNPSARARDVATVLSYTEPAIV